MNSANRIILRSVEKKMAKVTAQQVADYIINFANKAHEPITNLKLQKMVYYAQGYYLAMTGNILFDDQIEAWAHGPVINSLYQKYKHFRWQPVNDDVKAPAFDKKIAEFLNLIIDTFLPMDAFKLERMTHNETPWINARGKLSPGAKCRRPIKVSDMKEYFTALMA